MPSSLKRSSLTLLAVAIAFFLFFMAAKHYPSLGKNNPFAEDPYDAVGSFAIQYAVFISALSLLRSFRSYPTLPALASQVTLIAAGQVTGFAAVAGTLMSDLIALLRHRAVWSSGGPGRALSASILLLLLSTGAGVVPLLRLLSPPPARLRAAGVSRSSFCLF